MSKNIIVTTGDLKQDYQILGPVYFQVSNKGLFSSGLSKLVKQYEVEIAEMKQRGQLSQEKADWGFLYGEWSVGQSDFDKAFFSSTGDLPSGLVAPLSRVQSLFQHTPSGCFPAMSYGV